MIRMLSLLINFVVNIKPNDYSSKPYDKNSENKKF